MIRCSALWAALAVLTLPAPAMAGSAECIWDNLSQPSRDWAFSLYKPDGSISEEGSPPPDEEFERAAAACGVRTTDETLVYVSGAAGGFGLKKAAAARLKDLTGVDEPTLEGHWLALSAKQRQVAEQVMLDIASDEPLKDDDNRSMLFMGLYVLAGWTPDPEDRLLPHYINYYAGLVSASAYEKLF